MLLDFINLKNGEGAVYLRLYGQITAAVKSGIIKQGEKLPSIREAAAQLNVSRTTVENAYLKLCIEGTAESLPQRGYFIRGIKRFSVSDTSDIKEKTVKYDFSGRSIDVGAADTEIWKKTVREILRNTRELTSYGEAQGETALRAALADYTYKARGVLAKAENIVIGAGVGPLLNILCGIMGRGRAVAMENGDFKQASSIFSDYGIKTLALKSDKNGAVLEELEKSGADVLFLQPSALSKISVTGLAARRNGFINWAEEESKRLIIEDDYNGELRYTARSVTAFQAVYPEKTVYIGSFSKLLLPSVRIAYMVLPPFLCERFVKRRDIYNQTCGKVEQLALKEYIETGALEKHLRRLRKLYSEKSRVFCRVVSELLPNNRYVLYESALTAAVKVCGSADEIYRAARNAGIALAKTDKSDEIRLCFAGIAEKDIYPALKALTECL